MFYHSYYYSQVGKKEMTGAGWDTFSINCTTFGKTKMHVFSFSSDFGNIIFPQKTGLCRGGTKIKLYGLKS